MKRNLLLLFSLIFIYGCGHKTHDIYYVIEASEDWEDRHWITSWYKEYKIDKNTIISTMGLNISAYSKEYPKLNFEKKNLEILVGYQSNNIHICKKEDIFIMKNEKVMYPIKKEKRYSYNGDSRTPEIGCRYVFDINPLKIETFTLYFNDVKYHLPPLKFMKQEKERYSGPSA